MHIDRVTRAQFDVVETVIGQAEFAGGIAVPRAAVLLLIGLVGMILLECFV